MLGAIREQVRLHPGGQATPVPVLSMPNPSKLPKLLEQSEAMTLATNFKGASAICELIAQDCCSRSRF